MVSDPDFEWRVSGGIGGILNNFTKMKILYRLFIVAFYISIVGCDSRPTSDQIIGTWQVDSVREMYQNRRAPDIEATFIFKSDSTFLRESNEISNMKGKWLLADKRLLMIQNGDTTYAEINKLDDKVFVYTIDLFLNQLRFSLSRKE